MSSDMKDDQEQENIEREWAGVLGSVSKWVSSLKDGEDPSMPKEESDSIPYLGVLTSGKNIRNLAAQNPHYRLKKLAEANKEVKLHLFFFSAKGIDVEKKQISGMYYDFSEMEWKQNTFPYPHYLLRRGGIAKKYKERFRTFLSQSEEENMTRLNPSTLGNWKVYHYFRTVPSLENYLQETIISSKPSDLFHMLYRHPHVYLKGLTGRKGKNVIRVERTRGNNYHLFRYNASRKNVDTLVFVNYQELMFYVTRFYKGKKFMIQEGIDLLEIKNRRIDVRAELQRNEKDKIIIRGISARIGRANSPITTHAEAVKIDHLFGMVNISQEEKDRLVKEIETFLLHVYQETEKKFCTFAEMGIDFAIDKAHNIKFIECNSSSTKVSLLNAYGEETLEVSMKMVLLYVKHLYSKRMRF
ncbi:YheC/YheD family endospore coat-associated protein [Alteribacillus iranensis]|uniref:YheC/D like ATP-grasp n=1 Tax=Alteribacillus iranensis TaxID=930128 RepID=A0A1I2EWL1_9BACI|nr:YheC/YheD family protein [Alteribacillus iranensis]SFE97504.1 YheC/D like ATP-grasp [Alteribacillus iranensis]